MSLRVRQKKKIALVLSGGGIKAAAFHIGVCLALKEKGFRFAGGSREEVRRNFPEDDPMTIRLYVGSSAGAFISAILAAGYSVEALINAFNVGAGQDPRFQDENSLGSLRAIRYRDIFSMNGRGILKSIPNVLMNKSIIRGGFEALLKDKFKINGLFTTRALEKYLKNYALSHNEFKQLGVELFIIGTQLNHTRKAIFGAFPEGAPKKTSALKFVDYAKISEAVAASTSLPPVFSPYGIKTPEGKEMFFFDGEIRDTLSTHVASDNGADLVIASYSVHPYHHSKEIGSLHKFGIPVILNQALYQVIQQKIVRHIKYQEDIKEIYGQIDRYLKEQNVAGSHREKVLEIIRQQTNFKPEVDSIYIHPRPHDHEMFFADHFSLNADVLERIVRIGFKSAIQVLRNHDL